MFVVGGGGKLKNMGEMSLIFETSTGGGSTNMVSFFPDCQSDAPTNERRSHMRPRVRRQVQCCECYSDRCQGYGSMQIHPWAKWTLHSQNEA